MPGNPDPGTPDGAQSEDNDSVILDDEYTRLRFTDEALPAPVGNIAKKFSAKPCSNSLRKTQIRCALM